LFWAMRLIKLTSGMIELSINWNLASPWFITVAKIRAVILTSKVVSGLLELSLRPNTSKISFRDLIKLVLRSALSAFS